MRDIPRVAGGVKVMCCRPRLAGCFAGAALPTTTNGYRGLTGFSGGTGLPCARASARSFIISSERSTSASV